MPRRALRVRETPPVWETRYVVDASVAVKWVRTEPDSDRARHIQSGVAEGGIRLLAPELLRVEVAGALLRAWRNDAARAEVDLQVLERIDIDWFPVSGELMMRAVRIAGRCRLQAADSVYAALAEREGCLVVTADEEMARKLKPAGLAIRLSALP